MYSIARVLLDNANIRMHMTSSVIKSMQQETTAIGMEEGCDMIVKVWVSIHNVQGCTNPTCGKQHAYAQEMETGREAKSLIDVPIRPGTGMCFAQDKAGLVFKPFSGNAWSSGTGNSETKGVDWLHRERHPIPCELADPAQCSHQNSICEVKVEKHRNCGYYRLLAACQQRGIYNVELKQNKNESLGISEFTALGIK